MLRWEYVIVEIGMLGGVEIEYPDRTEKTKEPLKQVLHKLGEYGWELVSATDDQMGAPRRLFFKKASAS
jgi:hypothetical protein